VCTNSSFVRVPTGLPAERLSCEQPMCTYKDPPIGILICLYEGASITPIRKGMTATSNGVKLLPLGTVCRLQCPEAGTEPYPGDIRYTCRYFLPANPDVFYTFVSGAVPLFVPLNSSGTELMSVSSSGAISMSVSPGDGQTCRTLSCSLPATLSGASAVLRGAQGDSTVAVSSAAVDNIRRVLCNGLAYGDKCTPECSTGYVPVLNRSFRCTATGRFQGSVACVATSCPSEPLPTYNARNWGVDDDTTGRVEADCAGRSFLDKCKVTCPAGYIEAVPSPHYLCNNSAWVLQGLGPPCIEAGCSAPPKVINALPLTGCSNQPAGFLCEIHCKEGFSVEKEFRFGRCAKGKYEYAGLGCATTGVPTVSVNVVASTFRMVAPATQGRPTNRSKASQSMAAILSADPKKAAENAAGLGATVALELQAQLGSSPLEATRSVMDACMNSGLEPEAALAATVGAALVTLADSALAGGDMAEIARKRGIEPESIMRGITAALTGSTSKVDPKNASKMITSSDDAISVRVTMAETLNTQAVRRLSQDPSKLTKAAFLGNQAGNITFYKMEATAAALKFDQTDVVALRARDGAALGNQSSLFAEVAAAYAAARMLGVDLVDLDYVRLNFALREGAREITADPKPTWPLRSTQVFGVATALMALGATGLDGFSTEQAAMSGYAIALERGYSIPEALQLAASLAILVLKPEFCGGEYTAAQQFAKEAAITACYAEIGRQTAKVASLRMGDHAVEASTAAAMAVAGSGVTDFSRLGAAASGAMCVFGLGDVRSSDNNNTNNYLFALMARVEQTYMLTMGDGATVQDELTALLATALGPVPMSTALAAIQAAAFYRTSRFSLTALAIRIAETMAPGTTPAETYYATYWAIGCRSKAETDDPTRIPPLAQIHNILRSGALTARYLVAGIISSSDVTSAGSAVEDSSGSTLDIVKAIKASTSSSGAAAQCAATFVSLTLLNRVLENTAPIYLLYRWSGPASFLAATSLALESYDGAFILNLMTNTTRETGDWLSVGNVLAGMNFPGGQKGLTYTPASVSVGIIISLASGATSPWEALASVLFALSSGDVDYDLSFLGPYAACLGTEVWDLAAAGVAVRLSKASAAGSTPVLSAAGVLAKAALAMGEAKPGPFFKTAAAQVAVALASLRKEKDSAFYAGWDNLLFPAGGVAAQWAEKQLQGKGETKLWQLAQKANSHLVVGAKGIIQTSVDMQRKAGAAAVYYSALYVGGLDAASSAVAVASSTWAMEVPALAVFAAGWSAATSMPKPTKWPSGAMERAITAADAALSFLELTISDSLKADCTEDTSPSVSSTWGWTQCPASKWIGWGNCAWGMPSLGPNSTDLIETGSCEVRCNALSTINKPRRCVTAAYSPSDILCEGEQMTQSSCTAGVPRGMKALCVCSGTIVGMRMAAARAAGAARIMDEMLAVEAMATTVLSLVAPFDVLQGLASEKSPAEIASKISSISQGLSETGAGLTSGQAMWSAYFAALRQKMTSEECILAAVLAGQQFGLGKSVAMTQIADIMALDTSSAEEVRTRVTAASMAQLSGKDAVLPILQAVASTKRLADLAGTSKERSAQLRGFEGPISYMPGLSSVALSIVASMVTEESQNGQAIGEAAGAALAVFLASDTSLLSPSVQEGTQAEFALQEAQDGAKLSRWLSSGQSSRAAIAVALVATACLEAGSGSQTAATAAYYAGRKVSDSPQEVAGTLMHFLALKLGDLSQAGALTQAAVAGVALPRDSEGQPSIILQTSTQLQSSALFSSAQFTWTPLPASWSAKEVVDTASNAGASGGPQISAAFMNANQDQVNTALAVPFEVQPSQIVIRSITDLDGVRRLKSSSLLAVEAEDGQRRLQSLSGISMDFVITIRPGDDAAAIEAKLIGFGDPSTGLYQQFVDALTKAFQASGILVPEGMSSASISMDPPKLVSNFVMPASVWILTSWSTCPTTCGEGKQYRNITCSTDSDLQCDATPGPRPATVQECEDYTTCPFSWRCAIGGKSNKYGMGDCDTQLFASIGIVAAPGVLFLCCLTAYCAYKCRPPRGGAVVLKDEVGQKLKVNFEIYHDTGVVLQDVVHGPTGKIHVVWDLDVEDASLHTYQKTRGLAIAMDGKKGNAQLTRDSVNHNFVLPEDMPDDEEDLEAAAALALEDARPEFIDAYTTVTRLEYWSETHSQWITAKVIGTGYSNGDGQLVYNLLVGASSQPRMCISMDVLREPLKAAEPISVYSSRAQKWFHAFVEGPQHIAATTVGYTIRILDIKDGAEIMVNVPSARLRRRFPKDSLVEVFQGQLKGWVLGTVAADAEEVAPPVGSQHHGKLLALSPREDNATIAEPSTAGLRVLQADSILSLMTDASSKASFQAGSTAGAPEDRSRLTWLEVNVILQQPDDVGAGAPIKVSSQYLRFRDEYLKQWQGADEAMLSVKVSL
ncbi:unnamed protein product, partial [Polarella glacialis]